MTAVSAADAPELSVGSIVKVVGLVKAQSLNGRFGMVRRADPSRPGRWEVDFEATEAEVAVGKEMVTATILRQNLVLQDGNEEDEEEEEAQPEEQQAEPDASDAAAGEAPQPLQVGDSVRVRGLASAAAQHFNGLLGRLLSQDAASGRWHVKLLEGDASTKAFRADNLELDQAAAAAAPAAAKAPAPVPASAPVAAAAATEAPLAVGVEVRVHGLASAAAKHMNGELGRLHALDESSGRWHVKLHSGGTKAFKAANLECVAAGEAEAEAEAPEEEEGQGSLFGDLVAQSFGGDVLDGANGADYEEDEDEFDKGDESKIQGWEQEGEGAQEGEDASIPMDVDVDGTAENEFADLDANELAAAALEAELCGDTERQARLTAEVEARKAAGEAVSSGTSGSSRRVEEVVEVPVEAIGWVIGAGGDRIRELSSLSGTRMQISRDNDEDMPAKTRKCWIHGSEDQVAKAKELLQAAICESQGGGKGKFGKGKGKGKGGKSFDKVGEGAAGVEQGICKWYAAGFCRNRAFNGSCRNGLHNSEAARKAEEEWVALGPETGTQGLPPDPKVPVLLLLDLEGGGNKDGTDGEDEIIEVPVLSMCPITGRELGRFHRFARPGFWDREVNSMRQRFHPECFNNDSSAVPFPGVIHQMQAWLCKVLGVSSPVDLKSESFLFVTCGNWDVKTAIPLQCNKPLPGTVDLQTQQLMFSRWSNLKDVFKDHYRLDPNRAPTGMRGMLNRLKISLQGQHHLGMDDVSNLAKILKKIVAEGCVLKPTGTANNLAAAATAKGKGKFGKVGKGGKGKFEASPSGGEFGGKAGGKAGCFGGGGDFGGKDGGKSGCFGGKDGGKAGCFGGKGGGCVKGGVFGGGAKGGTPFQPFSAPGLLGKAAPAKPMLRPPQGIFGTAPSFAFPRPGLVFGAAAKAGSTVPPMVPPASARGGLKRPAPVGKVEKAEGEEAEGEEEDDYDPFAEEPAEHLAGTEEAGADDGSTGKRRRGLASFLQGAPLPGADWEADTDEEAEAAASAMGAEGETTQERRPELKLGALPKPKTSALSAGALDGIFDEPPAALPTGFFDASSLDAEEVEVDVAAGEEAPMEDAAAGILGMDAYEDEEMEGAEVEEEVAPAEAGEQASQEAPKLSSLFASLPTPHASAGD